MVPTADGMAGRGVTATVVDVSVGSPGTAPATVVPVVAGPDVVVDVVGVVVDVLVVVEVLVLLDEVVVDDSAGSTGAWPTTWADATAPPTRTSVTATTPIADTSRPVRPRPGPDQRHRRTDVSWSMASFNEPRCGPRRVTNRRLETPGLSSGGFGGGELVVDDAQPAVPEAGIGQVDAHDASEVLGGREPPARNRSR